MREHGLTEVVPVPGPSIEEEPIIDFSSGYIQRALHRLPKQGTEVPWKLRQNYLLDTRMIKRGPIEDGALRFSAPAPEREPAEALAS
jgi:hypothetical protein